MVARFDAKSVVERIETFWQQHAETNPEFKALLLETARLQDHIGGTKTDGASDETLLSALHECTLREMLRNVSSVVYFHQQHHNMPFFQGTTLPFAAILQPFAQTLIDNICEQLDNPELKTQLSAKLENEAATLTGENISDYWQTIVKKLGGHQKKGAWVFKL